MTEGLTFSLFFIRWFVFNLILKPRLITDYCSQPWSLSCGALSSAHNIYLLAVLVFVAALGLFSGCEQGYSFLWCTDFSVQWLLLFWSTGSRAQAHKLWQTGSEVYGIFTNQGLNLNPLHWQMDSLPLDH